MKDVKNSFESLDKKVQENLILHRRRSQVGIGSIQPIADLHQPFGKITYWESLSCIGYDPYQQVLEAVVQIKRPTGYYGDVCNPNLTFEFVRFFIDYGGGWVDLGTRQFKASDISTAPPGPQHPLNYLVRINVDTGFHGGPFCSLAAIPKVRAILSWNVPPPNNPNWTPFYGDVLDADIQLKKRRWIFEDLKPHLNLEKLPLEIQEYNGQFELPEVALKSVDFNVLHKEYAAQKIADHRTFFPLVAKSLYKGAQFPAGFSEQLSEMVELPFLPKNLEDLLDTILSPVKESNTGFEELTCVGLDTNADVLGAVVHIKNRSGYNGNLCTNGSTEYVAFWADWDNNGSFTEYLGTSSIRVHDINNIPAGGLYYNVNLPISKQVQRHLRTCKKPNVVRIRAVLGWEMPPSTTDPNALPFWGMHRDVLVQLRPVDAQGRGVITGVGHVDRISISNGYHLYHPAPYSNAAESGYNRPFGGITNIQGTLLRPAPTDLLEFRIDWKHKTDAPALYQTVATKGTWSVLDLNTLLTNTVTQTKPDGWFECLDNYDLQTKVLGDYLVPFNSSIVLDDTVTLRVSVRVNGGPDVVVDEFDLQIDNTPTVTSPTPNASVDWGSDVDIVIDGLDCKLYKKGSVTAVSGHLRAKHRHFDHWALDLQPSAHAHGATPVPNSRFHGVINDRGDDNQAWTLDLRPMDQCGYTVSLAVRSRVIMNSTPIIYPTVGVKYVGFGYFS